MYVMRVHELYFQIYILMLWRRPPAGTQQTNDKQIPWGSVFHSSSLAISPLLSRVRLHVTSERVSQSKCPWVIFESVFGCTEGRVFGMQSSRRPPLKSVIPTCDK